LQKTRGVKALKADIYATVLRPFRARPLIYSVTRGDALRFAFALAPGFHIPRLRRCD
jgi:hypothetical protein